LHRLANFSARSLIPPIHFYFYFYFRSSHALCKVLGAFFFSRPFNLSFLFEMNNLGTTKSTQVNMKTAVLSCVRPFRGPGPIVLQINQRGREAGKFASAASSKNKSKNKNSHASAGTADEETEEGRGTGVPKVVARACV